MLFKNKLFVASLAGVGVGVGWLCWSLNRTEPAPPSTLTRVAAGPAPAKRRVTYSPAPPSFEPSRTEANSVSPLDPRASFHDAWMRAQNEHQGEDRVPPAEVRKILADALATSGPSAEAWTRDAASTYTNLVTEVRQSMPEIKDLQISSPQCYAAGCIATLSYAESVDYTMLAQQLSGSKTIVGWPGAKMASPAEALPGGRREASWILIRPDDAR
jgi:hypothetical protein